LERRNRVARTLYLVMLLKRDVGTAKNYPLDGEIDTLNRVVVMFPDRAESAPVPFPAASPTSTSGLTCPPDGLSASACRS
jgi:hypothetical protein